MKLLHKYPDMTPYSPLHATGFFYHEFDYDTGMQHCYEALRRCDELWLCEGWRDSRGCNLEVMFAFNHNIPIYEIKQNGKLLNVEPLEMIVGFDLSSGHDYTASGGKIIYG